MGRKKIGIPQRKFDFAITPKSDEDWNVVNYLEELKGTNKLSEFLRSVVYSAILAAENKAVGQSKAIEPVQTPKPANKPTVPHGAQALPVGGWQGKSFSKASQTGSNGKRRNGASDAD